MSLAPEGVTIDELIRDLLLAMVSSQNQANKDFIAGIEELAATDITIGYKKTVNGKEQEREIKGKALAFGVLPALLTIQSGVIEIRTAVTVTKNVTPPTAGPKTVRAKAGYLLKTDTVDARYQNTYNYKAESSSLIRITVAPTPPSQALMNTINALTEGAVFTDKEVKT